MRRFRTKWARNTPDYYEDLILFTFCSLRSCLLNLSTLIYILERLKISIHAVEMKNSFISLLSFSFRSILFFCSSFLATSPCFSYDLRRSKIALIQLHFHCGQDEEKIKSKCGRRMNWRRRSQITNNWWQFKCSENQSILGYLSGFVENRFLIFHRSWNFRMFWCFFSCLWRFDRLFAFFGNILDFNSNNRSHLILIFASWNVGKFVICIFSTSTEFYSQFRYMFHDKIFQDTVQRVVMWIQKEKHNNVLTTAATMRER